MNNQSINLTDSFFKIYSEMKSIILHESYNKDVKNINNNKFIKFYNLFEIFYKDLNKIKNNQILIQGFIDKNYCEIKQVKFFLVDIKTPKSRSIHDKIFINIFKMNSSHVPLGITLVFEEFIKGIT